MRGCDRRSGDLFSYVSIEDRVPKDHPLRLIGEIANDVLNGLSSEFAALYSPTGRPSIPPEHLLRALLLQAFYSVRSERQLMEQLNYNMLFRWFVGLGMDNPVWDVSTFAKNRDRFSVDGTLIDAWAGMKSFRLRDDDTGGDDEGSGRNPDNNFRGQKRKNDTHASTTDPEARLYRKGAGKPARLCFTGHAVIENRSGLALAATVTQATGMAEREAAVSMLDGIDANARATVGGDAAYDVWRFKRDLEERGYVPHMARRTQKTWGGIPHQPPPGYDLSLRCRKRIEEIFGWTKTVAGQSKTGFRGASALRHLSFLPLRPTIWSECRSCLERVHERQMAHHRYAGLYVRLSRHDGAGLYSVRRQRRGRVCFRLRHWSHLWGGRRAGRQCGIFLGWQR